MSLRYHMTNDMDVFLIELVCPGENAPGKKAYVAPEVIKASYMHHGKVYDGIAAVRNSFTFLPSTRPDSHKYFPSSHAL